MPKGSAKSRRNHTFSYDGVNYRFSVPAELTEEQAISLEEEALRSRMAVPVRPTIDIEDNSPIDVPPLYREQDPRSTIAGQTGPLNKDEIDFGKRGILSNQYNKHFTLEDTAKIGASRNRHYAAAHIAQTLKNKWQADIKPQFLTRFDPDSGEILYLDYKSPGNPTGTNRWIRYQGIGPWGVAQGVAETAGYMVGATPGMLLGNPGGAHLGGSVGTAVAGSIMDYAKSGYGVEHGVYPDDPFIRSTSARVEGLKAGGISLAADTIFGWLARPGRINSYFFDKTYDWEFERGMAETEEIVARINELERKLGRSPQYDPSPAQRSNVQELKDLEATLITNQSSTSRAGHAERLRKRRISSERGLDAVLDDLLPETEDVTKLATSVGADVKSAVANSPEALAVQAARDAETQLKAAVEQYARPAAGVQIQHNIDVLRVAVEGSRREQRELEKAAWALVDDKIAHSWREVPGTKPRFAPGDEGWKLAKPGKAVDWVPGDDHLVSINVNDPALSSIILKWRRGQNGLFDGAAVDRLAPQVRTIIEAAEQGKQVPLSQIMNGVKQLRSIERDVLAGTASSPFGMDQAFLVELTTGLTVMRDKYLRQFVPDAVPALEAAESLSRHISDTYYRTNGVKDLLRKVANNPNEEAVGVMSIIKRLFPEADDGPMKALLGEIKNDAEAVAGLRAIAYHKYVTDVIDPTNHTVSPQAYVDFMQKHGRTYEALLGPNEIASMRELGGLGEALLRTQARFKANQKRFKELFPSIQRMSAEDIVNATLGRGRVINMHELGQLKTFLNSGDPALAGIWDNVVDAAKAEMRRRLQGSKPNLEGLVPSKIEGLLRQSHRLELLFGEQYVKDLRTVMHGLEILRRTGKSFTVPAETPTLTMFRWIWGPLSRAQRFLTASRKYQIQGYERTLVNILSSPDKLRTAIKHGATPVGSDMAAPIIALLGINYVNESGTGDSSGWTTEQTDAIFRAGKSVVDIARRRGPADEPGN